MSSGHDDSARATDKEREKQARTQRDRDDLVAVLATVEGRRFAQRVLSVWCQWEHMPPSQIGDLQQHGGRRAVGWDLREAVKRIDESLLWDMQRDRASRPSILPS